LYINDEVPKTHDINALLTKFADALPSVVDVSRRQLFARLSAFYLNNWYPEYKERLSMSLNKAEARNILEASRESFAWLLTLKP
jgi:HEPN domain-containing protein